MVSRTFLASVMACSLFINSFSLPLDSRRLRRDYMNNEVDDRDRSTSNDKTVSNFSLSTESITAEASTSTDTTQNIDNKIEPFSVPLEEEDDDEIFEDMQPSSTTNGGSNIFSLLNLVGALFPGANGNNDWLWRLLKTMITNNLNAPSLNLLRRNDIVDNEIEVIYKNPKSKTKQKLESDENSDHSQNSDNDHSDEHESQDEKSDEDNNAAEESVENGEESKQSKQVSESKEDAANGNSGGASNSEFDSDEPPGGGDGQGGGVLGLLAGLSGGEDGQSDLGSLLAAVGGIVANLSGDGVDINGLIASGLGLFVGLLSDGNENPGAVVASYLITSLDTISGGGAQNNGAFFGTFLSKLIKGTIAVEEGSESNENDEGGPLQTDSVGFFVSLIMGLLGDMSKGSSSSNPSK